MQVTNTSKHNHRAIGHQENSYRASHQQTTSLQNQTGNVSKESIYLQLLPLKTNCDLLVGNTAHFSPNCRFPEDDEPENFPATTHSHIVITRDELLRTETRKHLFIPRKFPKNRWTRKEKHACNFYFRLSIRQLSKRVTPGRTRLVSLTSGANEWNGDTRSPNYWHLQIYGYVQGLLHDIIK